MSGNPRWAHIDGDCWPDSCVYCAEEEAREPEPCDRCYGDRVVEQDQSVQEVGLVAELVPCPDCAP